MINSFLRKENIFFLSLLCIVFIGSLFGEESHIKQKCHEMVVTLDQLFLLEEGIFVSIEDFGLFPVVSLSCLETGVYKAFVSKEECSKHGAYCPSCGGCEPWNRCSFRCRCGN